MPVTVWTYIYLYTSREVSMSEAGDVKSTGREDAKEQLANAGGPVVGISWQRSVIVFSLAFLLATAIVWARQPPSKLFLSLSLHSPQSLFVSLFRSILRPTAPRN